MIGFSIGGLPRTGSAWLSCLLTYRGISRCLHEPSIGASTAKEVHDRIESWQPHCGSADGMNILLWRHPLFRHTAKVFIRREPEAIKKSLSRAGIPTSLSCLTALLPKKLPDDCLVVDFNHLFTESGSYKVWTHCLPDVPFDTSWWLQMHRLNIQVDPVQEVESLLAHYPQFQTLTETLHALPE